LAKLVEKLDRNTTKCSCQSVVKCFCLRSCDDSPVWFQMALFVVSTVAYEKGATIPDGKICKHANVLGRVLINLGLF
jgi:hypothetical protein